MPVIYREFIRIKNTLFRKSEISSIRDFPHHLKMKVILKDGHINEFTFDDETDLDAEVLHIDKELL